jgi:hypothetical protein
MMGTTRCRRQIEDKFRDCASFSAKLASADVEQLIELTANLEDVADISEITKLL